jgi:hypothetical protein
LSGNPGTMEGSNLQYVEHPVCDRYRGEI